MELADVTDSKSVGSNTVRVRPPPSAPSNKPTLFMRGLIAFVPTAGGRTRNLRVVQGCVIVLAPSFARCETNRASTIRRPSTLSPNQRAGLHFICVGGWENPQLAGKAWMPYKMNAQRLCRMQSPQSVHKRARMHDSGRTESAQGRADPNDRSSTTPPRHTFARSMSGVLFLVLGRRDGGVTIPPS